MHKHEFTYFILVCGNVMFFIDNENSVQSIVTSTRYDSEQKLTLVQIDKCASMGQKFTNYNLIHDIFE